MPTPAEIVIVDLCMVRTKRKLAEFTEKSVSALAVMLVMKGSSAPNQNQDLQIESIQIEFMKSRQLYYPKQPS
jgi:hypothetical protein